MVRLPFVKTRSRFERASDSYQNLVTLVGELDSKMKTFEDDVLRETVTKHKGKNIGEIKEHVPEIFAAIREAGNRTLKMRHFDVQITGGLALLDGTICEMKTGEGKTLVATLPLIIHGLVGKGAHLVTVNDYLAERDANWMKPLYEFFGLSVGVVLHGQTSEEKAEAYAADITYGTNNEFGFDYLRDNMAQSANAMVQRDLSYAIVDEVDSILIDEARTPLIISAPDQESTGLYQQFSQLVPSLSVDSDYNVDEKRKAATLTDDGVTKVEKMLGIENIYEDKGVRFVHHLEQALRAQVLYARDKDYVVKEGQVIIVDEFTGRLMEGRRYSEGLHQAIEAKERVKVQQESRTLATITFQNFFRLYDTLAGMTGTAVTSAEEFETVYNLDVIVIPTNRDLTRKDLTDRIFVTDSAKSKAIVEEIKERHKVGQPVLVGTIAIEKSEYISELLKREGVPHEVLNAKHHAREAEIITQAGQKGAVTISTNMAGRGTDIKLGEEVQSVGGLYVLGTERHEARRIDNQLRGRSGRQGDPGATQFFVSLDDDVMRVFGGDKIKRIMERLKLPENEPIENKLITKALNGAQERVEGYYFDMRKQVLSYDDVLNRQRGAIYLLRRGLLKNNVWQERESDPVPLHEYIEGLLSDQAANLVDTHTAEGQPESWDVSEIVEVTVALTGHKKEHLVDEISNELEKSSGAGPDVARETITERITELFNSRLDSRTQEFGEEALNHLEGAAALRAIDTHWMEHLDTMDYLRTGIGLRGYGQRDPLVEYQREGYNLFQQLLVKIKSSLVEVVFRAQPAFAETSSRRAVVASDTTASGGKEGSSLHELAAKQSGKSQLTQNSDQQRNDKPIKNEYKNVGRNDLCPCGSGKKFKKCHGA